MALGGNLFSGLFGGIGDAFSSIGNAFTGSNTTTGIGTDSMNRISSAGMSAGPYTGSSVTSSLGNAGANLGQTSQPSSGLGSLFGSGDNSLFGKNGVLNGQTLGGVGSLVNGYLGWQATKDNMKTAKQQRDILGKQWAEHEEDRDKAEKLASARSVSYTSTTAPTGSVV